MPTSFDLSAAEAFAQSVIRDGAVTIVGSGVSAAAGLPTMSELAEHLVARLPLDSANAALWECVRDRILSTDLESALDDVDARSPILDEVIRTVAEHVGEREREAIRAVALGNRPLPLTDLIRQLSRVNHRLVAITTNYDRLVETAVERARLPIDSGFTGAYYGEFDPKATGAMFRSVGVRTRHRRMPASRPHAAILKPHGSLDWYSLDEMPIRSLIEMDAPRLLITPATEA